MLAASAAFAGDPSCVESCKERTAACIAEKCTGLRGKVDESGKPLRSANGCGASHKGEGCEVWRTHQDRETRMLLFASNCDPFGTNPNGGQIFAMRPDGSRLRQLTHARGAVGNLIDPDGDFEVELPGPWAYAGVGPTP
jgi:hypothetical protein